MAIDKTTGKRKRQVVTEKEKKQEAIKKAKQKPKFDTVYEEELIKSLFQEDIKQETVELEVPVQISEFVHHERPGEEWDVPITEDVKYFDPELSYELTGYRPITMDKGLDFDPEPFCESARIFEKNGRYTEFPEGSKP